MPNFILSCDWGTSSFRLRLIDMLDRKSLGEIIINEGTSSIYNKWKIYCISRSISKQDFYLNELKKYINTLFEKLSVPLSGITVVISGMASSSIGLKELPYASTPFSVDGSDAIVEVLEAADNFPFRVMLISGVSNSSDVMRGEETQMVGLASLTDDVYNNEAVCIFPGTHSKHIRVQGGKLTSFETYITGEMFHLMSNHSILKDAVSPGNNKNLLDQGGSDAFRMGIIKSGTADLLHTLFSVRINQLFNLLNKEHNFYYLSGLLIGAELRSLRAKAVSNIQLCSGSNVYPLYQLGLQELDMLEQTSFIAPDVMDRAAVEAHIKIFQNQKVNS